MEYVYEESSRIYGLPGPMLLFNFIYVVVVCVCLYAVTHLLPLSLFVVVVTVAAVCVLYVYGSIVSGARYKVHTRTYKKNKSTASNKLKTINN